jgi:hypothetical protein
MLFKQFPRATFSGVTLLAFASCFTSSGYGQSQTFSSGSTGADGPLNITAPGVTYFNPAALNLHPANPNIFNFTTITIAQGATLVLTEEVFHGPAFFLATGDVVITGTLDLSGNGGGNGTSIQSGRLTSYAGSGGYGGGLGGGPGGTPAPEPGNGPGGGTAGTSTANAGNGQFTGNQFLVPLIGGSGGGGVYVGSGAPYTCFGGAGGAGGGAILIASSTSITISGGGVINANGGGPGGNCGLGGAAPGGVGSGGAVRLIANTITGSGVIFIGYSGHLGVVRLEAFSQGFHNVVDALDSMNVPFGQSAPFAIALPTTAPGSLTVTSINGTSINANPFSFPDTTINTSTPVTINIQAKFIPPGTVPTLTIFSETGPDQVITCGPLTGTLQSSTSTANVTFPTGGSRGFVKATWTH